MKNLSIAQKLGVCFLGLVALGWAISDGYQLFTGQSGQSIPFLGPLAMIAMLGMAGFIENR